MAGKPGSGITLNSGDQEEVQSGGTSVDTTISGGLEYVSGGGIDSGTTISQGVEYDDGKATQTVVDAILYVGSGSAGASASGTTINGGVEYVYSGSSDSGTVINSGGLEYDDGTATGTVVNDGQLYVGQSSPDAVAIGTSVGSAGILNVFGGVASNTSVGSGGIDYVYDGGTDVSATIEAGGQQDVFGGGTANGTVIDSGGTLDLFGGASISGGTLNSGAILIVDSGATVELTDNPPVIEVLSGSSVVDTIADNGAALQIYASGTEIVASGAVDNGTILHGGSQEVYGTASGTTTTLDGGTQTVEVGGIAVSAAIKVFGTQDVYGTASGTTIRGTQIVEAGGVASGGVDFGTENVYGTASNIGISGGTQTVEAGGVAISATDIGFQYVYGTASGTTVSGGFEYIYSGGTASGTMVSAGDVYDDGTATQTIVAGGGFLFIGANSAGAVAIGTRVGSGGSQDMYAGTASNTIVSGGGQDIVYGGVDIGATIASGAKQNVVGGVASGATVSSGGSQSIYSDASASGTTIYAGGMETVGSGGSDFGAHVFGAEYVSTVVYPFFGSFTTTQTVYGEQDVYGTATGAVLSSGGLQLIESGALASGTIIDSGGLEGVQAGGTDINVTVNAGGRDTVVSGGVVSRPTINGGTLDVQSSAIVSGSVTFEGSGGTYEIDGTSIPSNTVDGFAAGDRIDLYAIAYDSAGSATLTSGNVLQITESGSTYDINLDPTQNFTGNYFHLNRDAGTGTLVTEDQTLCFCRGVMIETPAGEVPVERLRVGDLVVTMSGEEKPVTWIGQGRRRITTPDSNARPVIVRAGALADGMPSRDLRLTRGHSLYRDGILIPVEFLINGHSILWDAAAQSVEFYHVELAEHDVLVADGAPAESYREDGNREMFETPEPPLFTTADTPWFAPVKTGGPELERVWRRLLERSDWVEPPATNDPGLHLLADGVRIDPVAVECRVNGFQGVYRFRLERAPEELVIVSETTVPRHMGINHDPRRLGVALRSIALRGSGAGIDIDYDSTWLGHGFHEPEHDSQHRWTTGRAPLPGACHRLFEGPFDLLLDVTCTTKYPLARAGSEIEMAEAA